MKARDISKARRFSYIFRFIDDLDAMNDYGEFERCYKDIYPPELELGKENHNNICASFLDLDIKIVNRKFVFSLYDKRDAFPFSIVRLPYCSSNMPSKIFYSSIAAEILRIGRTSSAVDDFTIKSKILLERMTKQGAVRHRVDTILSKTFNAHCEDLTHVANNSRSFITLLS